jgi:hypothetical protein
MGAKIRNEKRIIRIYVEIGAISIKTIPSITQYRIVTVP